MGEKQILFEPLFAEYIQAASGKAVYEFNVLLSSSTNPATVAGNQVWLPGWMGAINSNKNDLFLKIGPGDFLVHHAIALGLHVTTLILVKGALDARGSKLMPDKKILVTVSLVMVPDEVVLVIFQLGMRFILQ